MTFSSLLHAVTLIDSVLAHWAHVDAALAPGALTLRGGFGRAALKAGRDGLEALSVEVVVAENGREMASARRDLLKGPLYERLRQFRAAVLGLLPGTAHAAALPRLPGQRAREQALLRVLDDAYAIWSRADAAPPPGFAGPLVLSGGYGRGAFEADVAALREAYAGVTAAVEAERFARRRRAGAAAPIWGRLVEYRRAVSGAFAAGHPLIGSLPAISPGNRRPAGAPLLSGAWDAAGGVAALTWTPSAARGVTGYSVRVHPGPRYRVRREREAGRVGAAVTSFRTSAGLEGARGVAWFRVYALTAGGRAIGSNVARVARP
jgi:hypothetical protein